MKKIITPAFILFLSILNIHAQWKLVQVFPPLNYGQCIDALGDDFAVLSCKKNTLHITSDAGQTWIQKYFPADFVTDISLVDKNIFYVSANNGSFYKTTDGGDNWTLIYFNPAKSGFGNYIEMFDANSGIAMGDGNINTKIPLIIRTMDGTNWIEMCQQSVYGADSKGWSGIDFVDPDIGYFSPIGGIAQQTLLKTTNGGKTWNETNFNIHANVVKFYSKDFGLIAKSPAIYKTTDGAVSWTDYQLPTKTSDYINDIEFVPNNPNKVWLCSIDKLFFSQDSGKTWIQQNFSGPATTLDLCFTNEKTGWLLSSAGLVYYTNNGGGTITSIEQQRNIPTSFELFQNYPNPFNGETVISYQLSAFSFVTLKIYDLLGREVAALVNEFKQPGSYNSQFSIHNSQLSSGIYFYKLSAENFSSVKKMILLK